ncbi:MAG: amino acid ABC transporter permease [Chloroflexota bacterium]
MDWLTEETIELLCKGATCTVVLTVITSVASLVVGVMAGSMRLSGRAIWRWMGAMHVEVHRNVPALVLLLFWAFAVPNLFPLETRRIVFFNNFLINWLSDLTNLPLVYYAIAAVLALTLNTSAYIAELFRAGVGTIAQEQVDTARSLGASQRYVYYTMLVPQGLLAAWPAISTRLIHNMKNTSLAAFVSVPELFHGMQTAITRSFRALEFLLLVAVIYLALSTVFAILLRQIERLQAR